MLYYRLEADLGFRSLCCDGEESPLTDEVEFNFVRQFWTDHPIRKWQPPPIRFMTLEEDSEGDGVSVAKERCAKGISDCPFYSAAVLIFSSRAYDGLYDFFIDSGEFHPIRVSNPASTFYAFNCTTVLDALDTKASIIEYDREDVPPRPRLIRRYVFDSQVIGDRNVFRMKWPPPFAVYVSQKVIDRINQLTLKGFQAIRLTD